MSSLAFNAYSGLEKLCIPLHGSVPEIAKLIFRYLMPGILMTHHGSSEITPKGIGFDYITCLYQLARQICKI